MSTLKMSTFLETKICQSTFSYVEMPKNYIFGRKKFSTTVFEIKVGKTFIHLDWKKAPLSYGEKYYFRMVLENYHQRNI